MLLPIVFAGCSDRNYALSALCNGRVPAERGVTLSATFGAERYPVAAIERLQVVDDEGRPSAFVGAAIRAGTNSVELFGPQPGEGYLKLWIRGEPSDEELDEVMFRLVIDRDAPVEPPSGCEYTGATSE